MDAEAVSSASQVDWPLHIAPQKSPRLGASGAQARRGERPQSRHHGASAGPILAQHQFRARQPPFFGRDHEIATMRSMLEQTEGPCSILWLHGPAGVGKTALAGHFMGELITDGDKCLVVDGRTIEPTMQGFVRAVGGPRWPSDVRRLLLDSAELIAGLEGLLRTSFMPTAPEGALLIITSRVRPSSEWITDPSWWDSFKSLPVRNLSREDSAALLRRRGVPERETGGVLRFAQGHPLALALAADAISQRPDGSRPWCIEDSPDVAESLVREALSDNLTAPHREAVEILAMARVTTEELLRTCHTGDAARSAELFAWLRGLDFVEPSPAGLVPHNTTREAIVADLRWRDPARYEDMLRRVLGHLTSKALAPTISSAQGGAALDILYLGRHNDILKDSYPWDLAPELLPDRGEPVGYDEAMSLVAEHEGHHSLRWAMAWWKVQPRAFTILRRDPRCSDLLLVALRITPDAPGVPEDPAVQSALAWVAENRPLRPGEDILIVRWLVGDLPEEAGSLTHLQAISALVGRWMNDPVPAVAFTCGADGAAWVPVFCLAGHEQVEGFISLRSRSRAAYVHDWRVTGPRKWLAVLEDRIIRPDLTLDDLGPANTETPLSRGDFAAAVKEAFRHVHQPDQLGNSALLRSRVLPLDGGLRALRGLLAEVVTSMSSDPQGQELGRVLEVTFLSGTRSQEAAARHLALSYSTYRRRLGVALDRATDVLWERELYGVSSAER